MAARKTEAKSTEVRATKTKAVKAAPPPSKAPSKPSGMKPQGLPTPQRSEPAALALSPEAQAAITNADQVVAKASLVKVVDQATANTAGEMLVQLKTWQKDLQAKRDLVVKPLKAHVKTLEGLFKPTMDKFEAADQALRTRLASWHTAEAAKRAEEQRKLMAEAEEAQASGDTDTALALATQAQAEGSKPQLQTAEGGVSTRTMWDFEVEDLGQVPHHYFSLDEKLVRAAIKAGERTIPGVRIFEKTVLAVSGA